MRLIDVVKRSVEKHLSDVIYRGDGFIPSARDRNSAYEFLKGYEEGVMRLSNLILQEIHRADAVLVVRCKHCQHQKTCEHARRLGINGYCSEGERRSDGTKQ